MKGDGMKGWTKGRMEEAEDETWWKILKGTFDTVVFVPRPPHNTLEYMWKTRLHT